MGHGVDYEVEQKFWVDDLRVVERELGRLGVRLGEVIEQVDCYFAHPARDFAETDEALRIRRSGADCFLTYKGPKIDATTKTRGEIEIPLARGEASAHQHFLLLEALGFRRVAEVRKRRRKGSVCWQGQEIEAALDDVDQVGQFVELETVARPPEIEAAKSHLADLARRLGLSRNERRSYLELLLQAD